MKLVADKHGRICSMELFTPRTAFDAKRFPDGRIMIVELVEKQPPVAKAVKKSGLVLLTSNQPVSNEDTQRAMEDFL